MPRSHLESNSKSILYWNEIIVFYSAPIVPLIKKTIYILIALFLVIYQLGTSFP